MFVGVGFLWLGFSLCRGLPLGCLLVGLLVRLRLVRRLGLGFLEFHRIRLLCRLVCLFLLLGLRGLRLLVGLG